MNPAKSNAKATQARQQGNELYQQKKFDDALTKYNESICWAEKNSDDLALGYGNRSAACFETKEYEFALVNIALARNHNFPERLMAKLEKRERDCRQQITQRPSQDKVDNATLRSRLSINVEVNPRIPHIAKGVHLEELPHFGRAAIADRDFKVGDVLAQDRPLLGCASPSMMYRCCDGCTTEYHYNLIPCERCSWVMYCGTECRQKSWQQYHRFECGLTPKLHEVFNKTKTSFMGPRLFFHTLGLLNDDIKKMIKFVKAHPKTGNNPLALDYVNYDPIEELKEIHKMKSRPGTVDNEKRVFTAAVGLEYLKVLRQSALVKSLITTKNQMQFMQERFADYVLSFPLLAPKVDVFKFCIISSVFYDAGMPDVQPNVTLISSGAQDRIVVHQAVSKGTHLCYRNRLPWLKDEKKCANCPLCTKDRDLFTRDWETMWQVIIMNNSDMLVMFNAMQQLLQKHSYMASQCRFKAALEPYQMLISNLMAKFVRAELRANAIA